MSFSKSIVCATAMLLGICAAFAQSLDHAKQLSESTDVNERLRGIAEFRCLPTPSTFDELIRHFRDSDRSVRLASVEAFQHVLDVYDKPIIDEMGRSPNSERTAELEKMREPILKFARYLQMGDYLVPVLDAAASSSKDVAKQLAKLCSLFHGRDYQFSNADEPIYGCGTGYNFGADAAFSYLVELRPDAVVDMIDGDNIDFRARALSDLGTSNSPAAFQRLRKYASSPNNAWRLGTIEGLGKSPFKEAFEIAAGALRDPAILVRREAVASITKLNYARAEPLLIQSLNDQSVIVIGTIAEDIHEGTNNSVTDRVIELFVREDPTRQRALTKVMVRCPSERFIPLLQPLLNSADDDQRFCAVEVLGTSSKISSKVALIRYARDKSPMVRAEAISGLAKWNEPAVWETLIDALHDSDITVFSTACEIIGDQRVTSAIATLRSLRADQYQKDDIERALKKIEGIKEDGNSI